MIRQVVWWYIDRKTFLDALRLRINRMLSSIDEAVRKSQGIQNYICPKCSSVYSALDVPRLMMPGSLELHCERCGTVVQRSEAVGEAGKAMFKKQRMRQQLEPIIDSLQKLQNIVLPKTKRHDFVGMVGSSTTDGDAGDDVLITFDTETTERPVLATPSFQRPSGAVTPSPSAAPTPLRLPSTPVTDAGKKAAPGPAGGKADLAQCRTFAVSFFVVYCGTQICCRCIA